MLAESVNTSSSRFYARQTVWGRLRQAWGKEAGPIGAKRAFLLDHFAGLHWDWLQVSRRRTRMRLGYSARSGTRRLVGHVPSWGTASCGTRFLVGPCSCGNTASCRTWPLSGHPAPCHLWVPKRHEGFTHMMQAPSRWENQPVKGEMLARATTATAHTYRCAQRLSHCCHACPCELGSGLALAGGSRMRLLGLCPARACGRMWSHCRTRSLLKRRPPLPATDSRAAAAAHRPTRPLLTGLGGSCSWVWACRPSRACLLTRPAHGRMSPLCALRTSVPRTAELWRELSRGDGRSGGLSARAVGERLSRVVARFFPCCRLGLSLWMPLVRLLSMSALPPGCCFPQAEESVFCDCEDV